MGPNELCPNAVPLRAVPGAARAGGGLGPDGEVPGALHIQVPEGGAGGSLLSPHRAAAQHSRE